MRKQPPLETQLFNQTAALVIDDGELQLIRKRGYAYDNEECELGARCIAFPLRDYSGKIIAALSVTGPLGRMTDEFINSSFRTILETVQDISYQLGYHG